MLFASRTRPSFVPFARNAPRPCCSLLTDDMAGRFVEGVASVVRGDPDSEATLVCSVLLVALLVLGTRPDDSAEAHPASLRMSAQPLSRTSGAPAVLSGSARDALGSPLRDVEVRVAALSLVTRTDENGAYRLSGITAGTYEVTARAVGFEAVSVSITFRDDSAYTQMFAMRRSVSLLDSVAVRATRRDPRMEEFEEHRRVGLGQFLTRADLEAQRGQTMAAILGKLRSVGIVRGMGGRGWILSKRATASGSCTTGIGNAGSPKYAPDQTERFQGMVCACYAQVYLDNSLMNPGQPADPFDVNQFSPDQIESIEWYASPAQTPSKYARLNSSCGVYVMHTRRPP